MDKRYMSISRHRHVENFVEEGFPRFEASEEGVKVFRDGCGEELRGRSCTWRDSETDAMKFHVKKVIGRVV